MGSSSNLNQSRGQGDDHLSPSRAGTTIPGVETVLVRKRKRPEGSGRWAAYALGEDGHGHWLYTPPGSLYRGERAGIAGECQVAQPDPALPGLPALQLIPRHAWWTAVWTRDDGRGIRRISVDVCTPPVLADGEWSYVDLELDLLGDEPGQVETEDEDEFVAACEAGLITGTEASAARAAAATVERLIRDEAEPFGRAGWARWEAAAGSVSAPLVRLPR